MGVTVLLFAATVQKVRTHAFSPIIKRGLGRVSKWHVCEGVRRHKIIRFFQNLHRDITVWTECDKDVNFISIMLNNVGCS